MNLFDCEKTKMEDVRNFSCKLYFKTEELKENFDANLCNRNFFHDQNSWKQLQELQKLYKKLLLSDIEYSLEKKIEIDLWNYCFKDYISFLQLQLKNDKNDVKDKTMNSPSSVLQHSSQGGVRRATEIVGVDLNITLQWFLEMANGFFILLLEEICTTFKLQFSFLQRNNGYHHPISDCNEMIGNARKQQLKEKLNYICQFCLVHLGDIARYRNDTKQAETYYRQAIEVSPTSGQAYNQIGLLQAVAGNSLSSISYYARSIALTHPFPAASANLTKMYENMSSKIHDKQSIDKSNFTDEFLKFHALLHAARSLHVAHELCSSLNEAITSLIATESLTNLQLLQMTTISIFQFERISGQLSSLSSNCEPIKAENLSLEENIIRKLVIESIAGMLNAFLLPVYTLMQGKSLLKYFALPATKILLDWITINPQTLQEVGFLKRLQIWPSLCKVLNELSIYTEIDHNELNVFDLEFYPLPEDYDLRSYLPLHKRLSAYRHRSVTRPKTVDSNTVYALRAKRMIELGKIISTIKIGEGQSIIKVIKVHEGESEVERFESSEIHVSPKNIVDDVLKDIKNLKLDERFSDEGVTLVENKQIDNRKPDFQNKSFTEQSAKTVGLKQHGLQESTTPRKGQRTNVAMSTILRHAAVTPDKQFLDNDTIPSIGTTKQVKFQSSVPLSGFTQTTVPENVRHENENLMAQKFDYSIKYRNSPNARPEAINSSNTLPKGNRPLPNPGTIDFSVPPPSFLSSFASAASGAKENNSYNILTSPNMPNPISNSLISHRSNHMFDKDLRIQNDYQHRSFPQNLHLASQVLSEHIPVNSNLQPTASTMWPSKPVHPSNNNLSHSQSDMTEQLRYQLPKFGGINRTEQSLAFKNDAVLNTIPGISSDKLQFNHPYPANEVRNQINNSSDGFLNRASPMYHRLFSTDPTWSVTPGSLAPPNSESPIPDRLIQSNLTMKHENDDLTPSHQLNVKERTKSDLLSTKK